MAEDSAVSEMILKKLDAAQYDRDTMQKDLKSLLKSRQDAIEAFLAKAPHKV